MRKTMDEFNPDVEVWKPEHQDFLGKFDAGHEYKNFNDFINNESDQYAQDGDGVSYLVFDNILDNDGQLIDKKLVAFYTLSMTSIPYIDRIKIEEEERQLTGKEYDEQMCGIPALEIKMFAVDMDYQDLFYTYEGESMPISAWILRNIIDYAEELLTSVVGLKAVFLHSLPSAEKFYLKNKFHQVEKNMKPLHCVDSEFQAMYCSLRDVNMNYDE